MKEIRISNEKIHLRELSENSLEVVGYAAVYDVKSRVIVENGKAFYEIIHKGAFDNVMKREDLDVIACFSHDRKNKMLARFSKSAKTLELENTEKGLKYRFILTNETELERYVSKHLRDGNLSESSFVFTIALDDFKTENQRGDLPIRHIYNFRNVLDVAIVHKGAYPETDVELLERSLQEEQKQPVRESAELLGMQLDLINTN